MAPNLIKSTSCVSDDSSSVECIDNTATKTPKLGPEPTLISRRQVDSLYSILEATTNALNQLEIPYILTGGSLLGAIRQHSILFCDDDIDIAILESGDDNEMYEKAKANLPTILGNEYQYTIKPWEGGDKIRLKACSNVFLDVFVIRRYDTVDSLIEVIGRKKNGDKQSDEYVNGIVNTIKKALYSQGEINMIGNDNTEYTTLDLPCPIYHFSSRKAIELWAKEVYRECELYPLVHNLNMGPVAGLSGPQTPVWLLKRAFGDDCFKVYYQSMSHGSSSTTGKHIKDGTTNLVPLIGNGGQWMSSKKTPLSEQHYIPMQPVIKAKRRYTQHNKATLFEYLERQSKAEVQILKRKAGVLPDLSANNQSTTHIISKEKKTQTVLYMDGVFDLFHVGHLNAIEQCSALGDRVIIGVTGDEDASGYKRKPIMSEVDRTAIIKALKVVDEVVCPCPLVVTEEFMKEKNIDLVVHGFANPGDKERQREFFHIAMDQGKFQEIDYYSNQSTTDIIRRIQQQEDEDDKNAQIEKKKQVNLKWFGSALTAATNGYSALKYDPFPVKLRNVIEPQLRKATKKRSEALNAIKEATGVSIYEDIMNKFSNGKYAQEGTFDYDQQTYKLRQSFLKTARLPSDFDLSRLHENTNQNLKDELLLAFASNYRQFQTVYDDFVRRVCIPFVALMSEKPMEEVYYQSFPCVRMIRPGEFSIGPHADTSYGHHPCSINFYIPLTKIQDTASLFLESRPGSEDWHPIIGHYGMIKHFAGAICAHWTPENNTDFTRVSLDFRIIPGSMFEALKCGGNHSGGVRDVYREKDGYYSRSTCASNGSDASHWNREGPLNKPDSRCGFPWTKKLK